MYTTVQQCDFCREEVAKRCSEVFPEWYEDGKINPEFYQEVWGHVNENTPKVTCLTFLDEHNEVAEAYCSKHLRYIAEEIEKGVCSCFK